MHGTKNIKYFTYCGTMFILWATQKQKVMTDLGCIQGALISGPFWKTAIFLFMYHLNSGQSDILLCVCVFMHMKCIA
jgi:hypothetical protein